VRQGEGWAVFVVDGDRIRRVTVEVGQRNAEEADIRSGLGAGLQLVVHPSDKVIDGARVEIRRSGEPK
jgi:HlyD family secretion protein